MKSIHSKNIFLVLVLTFTISAACVLSEAKTPQASITDQPTAEVKPSNTPYILPSLIPTVEDTPTLPADTPTPVPENLVIPEESKALYQELSSDLNQFEVKISQQPKAKAKTTTFAVELAFANGNAGEALLNPRVLEYSNILLDRLQAMGVNGVVLGIKYPLLKKGFPRAGEYLKFYQAITKMCHEHKIKVLVEAGAIFSGTPYSSVNVDWSTETTDTFLQGLQDQLVLISTDIKPDYLTLANEPTTEEALTHLSIPSDVWQTFLETTLKKVDHNDGTLYGAGSGTWEHPEYMKAAFNVSGLDYIDLHIYPFSKDAVFLDRAVNYTNQARAAGKKVVVSECWLFKAGAGELTTNILGNMEKVQNRDVFTYWTPLDTRYMDDMINLADPSQMDFVSFFWMRNLFYEMVYSPDTQNLTTEQYNQAMNQGAIKAVGAGETSDLGKAFQKTLARRSAK